MAQLFAICQQAYIKYLIQKLIQGRTQSWKTWLTAIGGIFGEIEEVKPAEN